MTLARWQGLVTAALVTAACSDGTAVDEVRWAVDPPPEQYRAFWTDALACSGLSGDFDRVRWFWTHTFPGQYATVGQWNERHEITLLWRFRFDRGVVVHEILHELLDGDGDHSGPEWRACDVPT